MVCHHTSTGILLQRQILFNSKKLRTVPNLFVGHLAAIDWLVCVSMITNLFIRSHEICVYMAPVVILFMGQSLFSMAQIAVNRYILICRTRAGSIINVQKYTQILPTQQFQTHISQILKLWVHCTGKNRYYSFTNYRKFCDYHQTPIPRIHKIRQYKVMIEMDMPAESQAKYQQCQQSIIDTERPTHSQPKVASVYTEYRYW